MVPKCFCEIAGKWMNMTMLKYHVKPKNVLCCCVITKQQSDFNNILRDIQ